jgi:hypothetical protein
MITFKKPHTQDCIAVYVTKEEKQDIKKTAQRYGLSMSKYLLSLHIESKGCKSSVKEPERINI